MNKGILMTLCLMMGYSYALYAAGPDKPFMQTVSVKFAMPESLKGAELKKIVTDYNDIIFLLTNRGVYRVSDNEVVKDLRYTPLAGIIPEDIAVQEGSGHLFYLYKDHFLSNGYAGSPYFPLPADKYSKMAVAEDGTVLLAGKNSAALVNNKVLTVLTVPESDILSVYVRHGIYYSLNKDGIYRIDSSGFKPLHLSKNIQSIVPGKNEINVGTANGYYAISSLSGDTILSIQNKLPVNNIRCIGFIGGHVWAGTEQGGFTERYPGYRYYASKRWLNEDNVTGITSDSRDNVYFLTPTGLNKIEFRQETLKEKATYYQNKIRQRHIRYGFIANSTMTEQGKVETGQMTDTDNDGLWSAFYLGSQVFRYAVTRDQAAKRYAWEAFEAFERILSVNPLKDFPARTFERKGFKYSDPHQWHPSQDSNWEWKGSTSSDEFVGYLWVASVLSDFAAESPTEKKRIAVFIDKILMHIINNNYYLIDFDGKPTLWGRWNPEYINSFPETVDDRKLGSTTIIAGLQLGYRLTGKPIYKKEALRLMNSHGYLKNIQISCYKIGSTKNVLHKGIDLGDGGWNHSDDEMAFLTYWVLYRTAFDTTLRQKYAAVIRDHWNIEKPERNAVWNLISLGTGGAFDNESTLWHLREFPIDLVRWDVKNSHRKDIVLLPPNFRNQLTKVLLPPNEAPMHRHNTNAFELDDGEHGMTELAGDEYLLPYWMARYLKVIE